MISICKFSKKNDTHIKIQHPQCMLLFNDAYNSVSLLYWLLHAKYSIYCTQLFTQTYLTIVCKAYSHYLIATKN